MSIRCREVYMTRKIMEPALSMLSKRCDVTVNRRSRPASKVEIIKNVADKDAILSRCQTESTLKSWMRQGQT